ARVGAGFSFRVDRGAQAGRVAQVSITRTPGDTLVGVGREFATTETWSGWGIDLRTKWRAARFAAEYLTGVQRARATTVAPIVRLRAGASDTVTTRFLGAPVASEEGFDLDHGRRVIVRAGGAAATQTVGAEIWSARPGTGILAGPRLVYEYEEHDFSALPTGSPFLMRRNTVSGGVDGRILGVSWRVDAEQPWFEYPSGADWQTQFWLRSGNFWLDEDVVGVDRLTLLGTPQAAMVQAHATGLLWPSHAWKGELHITYSAPGFDRAPRLFETIARIEVPLGGAFYLRTHSRLPVYRRFEPTDAAGIARLGPGARIEAGAIDLEGIRVDTSYRAFSDAYVQSVYALTARAD